LAVKLRLARMGKKKQPFYRIVAADSRSRRNGKYIEKIGYYNPITNPAEIVIDEQRAFYWLKNGAIPTETVKSLFSKKGILLKWHHTKHGHDEAKVEEEYKKWELLQLERKKREEALAAQAQREHEPKANAKESIAEAKDEALSDVEKEPVSETEQDSLVQKKENAAESQSESEAPDQQVKETQPEEQTSETQQTEEPDKTEDK